MIHEEKILPSWNIFLILIAAFILIYPVWDIGMRDLFWDEGELAAIASEIHSFPPDARAHGELIRGFYPLFALLAKILTMLGLSMELSLRLLSVLSLGGLTVMVGIIGNRMAGLQAGAVSAACMFTTIMSCDKAIEGYPQMLTVLLIFSGWIIWFNLGQYQGEWKKAWIFNGLFSGLAFYCGGWTALLYFYLPMMFLKRPFTPWRRLNNPGFPIGMLILFAFLLLWIIPRWEPGAVLTLDLHRTFWEYLWNLIKTPWDIFVKLLPWSLFLYAPFCPALIEIDRNPLISKYLRVLFIVSCAILVLSPFSGERDIMFLLPSFSLLMGLNYWIVVRRHGDFLCSLFAKIAFCLMLLCICTVIYEIMPRGFLGSFFLKWHLFKGNEAWGRMPTLFRLSVGSLFAGTAMILALKKRQLWIIFILCMLSISFFHWAVVYPYRASQRSRSELGHALRKAVGASWSPSLVVYKDSDISGLYPECYYLGTRIKTIPFESTGTLKEKEVFLLSVSSIQPQNTARTWTKVLDVIYKNQNLYMWKGVLNDRKDGSETDIRSMRF